MDYVYTDKLQFKERQKVYFLSRDINLETIRQSNFSNPDLKLVRKQRNLILESCEQSPSQPLYQDLVLCATDPAYFLKYGPAMILSHSDQNVPIHFHIDSVQEVDILYMFLRLFDLVPEELLTISFTITHHSRNTYRNTQNSLKAPWQGYYGIVRFIIAEWFLKYNKSVTIADGDMILESKPPEYASSVMLAYNPAMHKSFIEEKQYIRPQDEIFGFNTKPSLARNYFRGGLNHFKNDENGRAFLKRLNEKIETSYRTTNTYYVGLDQVALFYTWKDFKDSFEMPSIFGDNGNFCRSIMQHTLKKHPLFGQKPRVYLSPHRPDRWFTDNDWYANYKAYMRRFYS